MAVYPKGDKFMASVGSGSNRRRQSFASEGEALLWEKANEAPVGPSKARVVRPLFVPAGPPIWTLQEALDNAVKKQWVPSKGGSAAAIINANLALAFFGPDTSTSAITTAWVEEWLEELEDTAGNCGGTINRKLSALMVMLKRSAKFGNLKSLPVTERRQENTHRVRWFSVEEESLMLRTCLHMGREELHDFIVVGLDTGFRRMENLNLTVKDYHNGRLLLHEGETKSGKARSVPCTARVRAIIEKRQTAGDTRLYPELSVSTLRRQWEDLRATLGKTDDPFFILHVLRHTCCSRLVSRGAKLTTVKDWMGHSSIETTMRYRHLMPGDLEDALEALEAA